MGRPKEFDVDEAVDAAMHAFWERGYEATSTQDLCDATGLCRSSIYHTFGSKRELYERSLARYDETRTADLVGALRQDGAAADKLRAVFDTLLAQETGEERGCFAVNTLVELGGVDDDLAAGARRGLDSLRDELRCVIECGQAAGEITRDRTADALTDFVHGTMLGLRVLGRGGAGRDTMEHVVAVAMAAL
ncbi:TetR/AcrR family transcriptional regulator [Actinocatenispora rupis]|uniref:TetR family transcriptional regulator n=1 Tax=Actinocatenispora rupis TaxID=519421 RepID=A0A8J3NCG3_9ACTN|nr:TetR/AcrR family transcriptional regulator [Actinocatenispora rupis]GID14016.1 TetR family transcriptional regulator [Actinocatenispora rupis]